MYNEIRVIDWEYWASEYENDYNGPFITYIHKHDSPEIDPSPYFNQASRVIKQRGYLLKKEFQSICEWKTLRQRRKYELNDEDKIKEASSKAMDHRQSTEEKVIALRSLKGVGVPVASALLTVIYPEDFCVIDYRAWRALIWLSSPKIEEYEGYSLLLDKVRKSDDLGSYMEYLGKVRNIAKHNQMTARKIEMALWKFDKKRGKV